jgi:hypothetical protein
MFDLLLIQIIAVVILCAPFVGRTYPKLGLTAAAVSFSIWLGIGIKLPMAFSTRIIWLICFLFILAGAMGSWNAMKAIN